MTPAIERIGFFPLGSFWQFARPSIAAAADRADLEIRAAAHVAADLTGEVAADKRDIASAVGHTAGVLAVENRCMSRPP
jgi:hypothetical protein